MPKGSLSQAGTLKAKLPFNYLRVDSDSVIYDKTSVQYIKLYTLVSMLLVIFEQ